MCLSLVSKVIPSASGCAVRGHDKMMITDKVGMRTDWSFTLSTLPLASLFPRTGVHKDSLNIKLKMYDFLTILKFVKLSYSENKNRGGKQVKETLYNWYRENPFWTHTSSLPCMCVLHFPIFGPGQKLMFLDDYNKITIIFHSWQSEAKKIWVCPTANTIRMPTKWITTYQKIPQRFLDSLGDSSPTKTQWIHSQNRAKYDFLSQKHQSEIKCRLDV